jgi:hypothetical protein
VNAGLTGSAWPIFIAYFILANAWLEEYFWRGLLNYNTSRIALSDVFFSGYHILILAGITGISWLAVIYLIILLAGWSWRRINRRYAGLLPSFACHAGADISVMLAVYVRAG